MTTKRSVFGWALAAFVLIMTAAGCSQKAAPPSEAAARGFMDAYYLQADLQKAQSFADGLALERVRSSLSLREGLSLDAASHQPRVQMKLLDSRAGPDEAEYFFEVEFHPEKAEPVRKKTRLKVRLRDGLWKVTQFSDHDIPGAP